MLEGPFRGSEAVTAGLLTVGVLRGPTYERLLPDVYAPSDRDAGLMLRSQAAHVWLAGATVLSGYWAAEIYHARCAPADARVEVIIPGHARRAPSGITVRRDLLGSDEHRSYHGVRLTTPVRTAYDLARRAPSLVEAVVAVDSLAGRFGFAPRDILTLARRYPRARGRRRLSEVVDLAEPLAESAMETRVRLIVVLAGLPHPKVQHTIVDERGRMLATVDLAYRRQRIAIEYEGAEHFEPLRTIRDARRYTRLVALGWRVYRYVAADVYGSPDRIVEEITDALRVRKLA
jgi:very-short-patch-repair endonuclease